MFTYLRFCLVCGYLLANSLPVCSKAILQGTVTFLNSGSKPAQGVKIFAFGAQAFYTTQDGLFFLEFPDKRPGDRVRISVGGKDQFGVAFVVVNDKMLESLHLPSNPDVDIVEIFVCPQERLDEEKQKYYGIFAKDIYAKTDKRLRKIEQGILSATASAETVASLQREKEKLLAERDSALARAEEQALFVASLNLDKASLIVKDAVSKVNDFQDITGAITLLDNEILIKSYEDAKTKIQKSKTQIDQVIEGFKLKINLLTVDFQNQELNICCKELERIYKEQHYELEGMHQCFYWTALDIRETESLNPNPQFQPQSWPQMDKNHGPKDEIVFGVGGSSQIGDLAVNFTLQNVDGAMVSLSDFNDSKGIILIFTANSCPYTQLYEQRIIDLHRKFAPLGFPVIAINPNSPTISPDDSFEKMQEVARRKRYPFVYLKDAEQSVYPLYGANRTPHAFVLDNQRKIRYIGAIDNNPESSSHATRHYVENAVMALLKGEKPEIEQTRSVGLAIKKASSRKD